VPREVLGLPRRGHAARAGDRLGATRPGHPPGNGRRLLRPARPGTRRDPGGRVGQPAPRRCSLRRASAPRVLARGRVDAGGGPGLGAGGRGAGGRGAAAAWRWAQLLATLLVLVVGAGACRIGGPNTAGLALVALCTLPGFLYESQNPMLELPLALGLAAAAVG